MSDHRDSEIEDEDDMHVAIRVFEETKANCKWKYLIEWDDYSVGGATWKLPENFNENEISMQKWNENVAEE